MPNRLNEIAALIETFNSFADQNGLAEPIRRSVSLILDELLSNIISYAYDDDEEHIIDVRIEVVPDRLAVTVSDDGKPFNLFSSNAPDTGLGIEERKIGGLGIHLVRNIVDEVVYNRRADRNVVSLVKYLKREEGA